MSHYKPNSKLSNNQVDWNEPHLESLLRKTEGWKLDNRGGYPSQEVHIQIGWGAHAGREAVLVWETDQVMVLETRFSIPQGEHVRVDRIYGDGARTLWGMVAEGREGFREEDRQNGVYVHWLHVR
jgi:hypothetical protein